MKKSAFPALSIFTVCGLLILSFFAIATEPATADPITYWRGGVGSWHDPLNWDNGIPEYGDYAFIDNGGTAQITANVARTERLFLGHAPAHSGTVTQSGGTNTIDYYLYIGYCSHSSGTYNLGGDGILSAEDEFIGSNGTGEFNQSGGTHIVNDDLYLGFDSGSSGTYNFNSDGILSAKWEHIGHYGTGKFTQSGGTHTVDRYLYIGRYSSGTYNLGGTGQLSAYREHIGCEGTGEFNQTSGTNTVDSWLCLGYNSGFSGTYNLSGTGQLWTAYECIGHEGTGEFTQTGGTNLVNVSLFLGYESGSSGTYYLSGGSLEAGDLDINNGWMDIDVSGIDLFAVHGDRVGLLDGYIAEGKIFDSTLCPDGYLYAVYDPYNDWTTLAAVPEPCTILLLTPGLLGVAGVLRRKFRNR